MFLFYNTHVCHLLQIVASISKISDFELFSFLVDWIFDYLKLDNNEKKPFHEGGKSWADPMTSVNLNYSVTTTQDHRHENKHCECADSTKSIYTFLFLSQIVTVTEI